MLEGRPEMEVCDCVVLRHHIWSQKRNEDDVLIILHRGSGLAAGAGLKRWSLPSSANGLVGRGGGGRWSRKASQEASPRRGHMVLLEGLVGVYRDFSMRPRWDSGSGVQKVLHTEKRPQGKIQKPRQAQTSYLLQPLTCTRLLTSSLCTRCISSTPAQASGGTWQERESF